MKFTEDINLKKVIITILILIFLLTGCTKQNEEKESANGIIKRGYLMSWDIFIQDLPSDITNISEIPDDFKPKSIGQRDDIINKILKVEPRCDFTDKAWGLLDGENFSIEFNMGDEEVINGFALHIRGNSIEVVEFIEKMLIELNLRALDPNNERFFNKKDAMKSFSEWQKYRDQVTDNSQ